MAAPAVAAGDGGLTMYNADLHAPARWRLRAVSIGAGALFITGGSMVIGWAPSAMAAAPKPAPEAKPAPAPKDDTSAADKKAADDAKKAADQAAKDQAAADKKAADDAKKAADQAAKDQAAADKKAADDAKKAQEQADKQAADEAKKTAEAEKKAQQQAAKDAKKNPPSDSNNSGGDDTSAGPASNPGQGSSGGTDVPPGQVDNPGNHGDGNNGQGNDNQGTGNNGQGNGNQDNNGDNGNHGTGNNGTGNNGQGNAGQGNNGNHGQGNQGAGNGNGGGVFTPPGQVDNPGNHGDGNNGGNGHHGQGNSGSNGHHGQGNSGNGVGHKGGPVSNVAFGDVMPGSSVGPENWTPFGSADSVPNPLAVLLLGPAADLATAGSMSGAGLLDGQTHVLGQKFEAASPAAQLSATEMLKQFDKKSKAHTQRVKADGGNGVENLGAALTSGSWKSTGNAVPLLLLLLIAEMLILGRRFGNKVRRSRPAAPALAVGAPMQVRWA